MGKKGKALKIKQYKVPEQKFLVVIFPSPWAVDGNFNQAEFDRIGAWFEQMLRVEYLQYSRIKAIYYQRTHRNIIVELQKEVQNVESLLGAHLYSNCFLDAKHPDDVAYIYEYRYATCGDPSKRTFVLGLPGYDSIHKKCSIKDPYPPPSPAPPPPIGISYALPISPEVNERIASRLHNQTSPKVASVESGPSVDSIALLNLPSSNGFSSQHDNFIPYVRPSHLGSTIASANSPKHRPKTDPYDGEEETLDCHVYKPSAELLDALNSLPEGLIELNARVKAERMEEYIKLEPTDSDNITLSANADYQPSVDLLLALATLPDNVNLTGETMEPTVESISSLPKRCVQGLGHEIQLQLPSKRIKREASD